MAKRVYKQSEKDFMDNLAKNVTLLCEVRGLTISGLAEKSGVSQGTISKFINRKTIGLTMITILRIQTALNVDLGTLFKHHDILFNKYVRVTAKKPRTSPYDGKVCN